MTSSSVTRSCFIVTATSARLSTTGNLRGCDSRTSLRARSGRSTVWREEEAKCRHDAVHHRHGNAAFLLLDLETAQIAEIVALRLA